MMSFRYMETIIGPKYAVVIPCYNEEKYVGRLLKDLCQQTVQPDMVVVADCDSEDNTIEVVKRYEDRLPLQIVRSTGRSPAAARNGAAASMGCNPEDYLVFVDADMRLPADFLQKLQAVTQEYPVDFVTPRFVSDGRHAVDSISVRSVNVYNRYVITRRNKVAGIGGVMVVRGGMHDYVDGFPEDVVADDMWYVARLNKAGATAHYASGIRAVNSSRRLREDGIVNWLMGMMPERSLPVRMRSRFTHRIPKRTYGHYGRKAKAQRS